jgi:hypothetical protein
LGIDTSTPKQIPAPQKKCNCFCRISFATSFFLLLISFPSTGLCFLSSIGDNQFMGCIGDKGTELGFFSSIGDNRLMGPIREEGLDGAG